MPNVDDVAAWLDAPEETTFEFGEEYRPVDLNAGVKTYTHGDNSFADKYRRLYRALDLAEPHLREDGQSLVFVSSRQDTVQAAKKARDEIAERDIPMGLAATTISIPNRRTSRTTRSANRRSTGSPSTMPASRRTTGTSSRSGSSRATSNSSFPPRRWPGASTCPLAAS